MKKIFILLACFCLFASIGRADDVYGLMMVVKGDVSVVSKDKKEQKAHIGSKVYPGDTIITKKDARAKVVMVDKNVINISPDSKFLIAKYEYNPEADKKGALLNVIYGKIRTTVNQKYDGEKNTFRVKTSTAVAGVRGTDFMVSFSETTNTSKVVTFRGKVEVGSGLDPSGHIQGSVFVIPGQYTIAAAHQAPTIPAVVPPQELANMKEQTLADSPSNNKDNGNSRQPSSNHSGPNSSAPSGNANPSPSSNNTSGHGPASVGGNTAGTMAPPAGTSSTLGEMGENATAPALTAPPPPPPTLPFSPVAAANPCPNGNCLPTTIDPSLLKGTTKVIVNLQP